MRRALLVAVLAVLVADASGISALLAPETCAIETGESAPDGGCPAFCVRCTCASCAASIEYHAPDEPSVEAIPPVALALRAMTPLPIGSPADILHVPKTLPT